MFLTFFLAIFTTLIVLTLSDFEVNNLYIIYFMVLPTTLMLFIVYINEVIKDAVLMRSKLIKMEKMEIVSQLICKYIARSKESLNGCKRIYTAFKNTEFNS